MLFFIIYYFFSYWNLGLSFKLFATACDNLLKRFNGTPAATARVSRSLTVTV